MKKEKVKNKKHFFLRPKAALGLFLFLFLGIFVAGSFAFAGNAGVIAGAVGTAINNSVATALSAVVGALVNMIGGLLTMMVSLLISVAKYNEFIRSGAVLTGWVIVRDICNMFFILILLVIAFATILRIEGYDIKKMVPKLIIMAVLINFSKTICGLILDAANLVMNTFVNAFGDTGGVSMVQMMGLNDVLSFVKHNKDSSPVDVWKVFGAYIFALVYVLIAIVVVIVLLMVLVVRIVMLWIYIVLSPLAYLMATFPQGKKYASMWWDDFTKYVITGPILAFFLWLSFVSLGKNESSSTLLGISTSVNDPSGVTQAMTTDNLIRFIISIGMLMGGLIITQQAGGAMGKIAGAGISKIQGGVKLAGKATVGALDWANRQQAKQKWGFDLNMPRQFKNIKESLGRGKQRELDTIERVKSERLEKKGTLGLIGGFGARGWGDVMSEGVMGWKGFRRMYGGKKLGEIGEEKKANDSRIKAVFSKEESDEQNNEIITQRRNLTSELASLTTSIAAADAIIKNSASTKDEVKDAKREKAEKEAVHSEKNAQLLALPEKQRLLDEKYDRATSTMDENGQPLWFQTKEEAAKRKDALQAKSLAYAREGSKYKLVDVEGRKQHLAQVAEARKKYSDEDNEDVLISELEVAFSKKDNVVAEGILARLAEVGGTNGLLAKYGYQAKGGLNKDEEAPLLARINAGGSDGARAQQEYNGKRGWNDFMRNEFGKRTGMGEQSLFTLENYISGIGEHAGKEHLTKTINVDATTGELYQVSGKARERSKLIESRKMSNEKKARDYNRLWLGAENVETGDFEFSDFGLAEAVSQLPIYLKEAEGKRLNASIAVSITQPKARQKLEDTFRSLGIDKIRNAKGDLVEVKKALDSIADWARTSGANVVDKIVPPDPNGD